MSLIYNLSKKFSKNSEIKTFLVWMQYAFTPPLTPPRLRGGKFWLTPKRGGVPLREILFLQILRNTKIGRTQTRKFHRRHRKRI